MHTCSQTRMLVYNMEKSFPFSNIGRPSTEIVATPSTSFSNEESNIDEATKNTSALSIDNKTNNTIDAENLANIQRN